jgi:hypothetical protein
LCCVSQSCSSLPLWLPGLFVAVARSRVLAPSPFGVVACCCWVLAWRCVELPSVRAYGPGRNRL